METYEEIEKSHFNKKSSHFQNYRSLNRRFSQLDSHEYEHLIRRSVNKHQSEILGNHQDLLELNVSHIKPEQNLIQINDSQEKGNVIKEEYKNEEEEEEDEEEVELLYDPVLKSYYDPKTNNYYDVVDPN